MKASDLFVKCLEAEGIEYIFGVPGEENADFMMSLEASESIRFVLDNPHVHTLVIGSLNAEHLRANVAAAGL